MDFSGTEENYMKFKLRTLDFKIDQMQKTLHDEDVLAEIRNGKIRGSKRQTLYNKIYYSFEGIPYAEPPLGELRFKDPKPMTNWTHIRDCTWYGPKAMQKNVLKSDEIEGSENCLLINVYTKDLKPTKPRPVMVWIHGGAFFFGEANREWYGPDHLLQKDVILVTLQYRLGALGFLSFDDPSLQIPGNAGLKDALLALKWVKKNVANFGGNPECITIFGESAGAAIVHFLTLSEKAQGLFHRAIIQSGAATADWFSAANKAYDLALKAGYKGENKQSEVHKYLLTLTAEEIIDAEKKCTPSRSGELFPFGPMVETYINEDTVLSKPVEELQASAWSNCIPVIIGATSMEGLFFERPAKKNEKSILSSFDTCVSYVPRTIGLSIEGESKLEEKGKLLRKLHCKSDKPTVYDFYEMCSYSYIWHPIHKAIEARLKYAPTSPTYLYRFDFMTKKRFHPFRLLFDNDCGVSHTDELSFLFSSSLAKPLEHQSREYQCMQCMITLWTEFAATGNPNGANISNTDIQWHSLRPPSKVDNNNVEGKAVLKCLNISDDLTFIDLPEMEKLKVWKSLY